MSATPTLKTARPEAAAGSWPPFTVITGSGRSGTTFLADRLYRTLSIGIGPEPKFLVPFHGRAARAGDLSDPARMRRLIDAVLRTQFFDDLERWHKMRLEPGEIVGRLREPSYRGLVYAIFELLADKRACSRAGFKEPGVVDDLPLLAELLPTARFVHIYRDGRDVAMSLLKFPWGPNNLYAGARYWAKQTRQGRADGAALGDRYFEIRYEDLVLETERVVPPMVDFILGGRDPATVERVLADIQDAKNTKGLARWKTLSVEQRRLCEAAAGDVLRECGYETEFADARVGPVRHAGYLAADFARRVGNVVYRRATGWKAD